MALTTAQVADIGRRYQRYGMHVCSFDPIPFDYLPTSPGPITWKPFCLLSPRFSFSTGEDIVISGTDSYVRPTTPVDTVTFTKLGGSGTVTDNGDKTCTVSFPGSPSPGITTVQTVATVTATGETAIGYASVRYDPDGGDLNAYVSKVDGISGSLDNGAWKGTIEYRGVWPNDVDVPILCHSLHYWDGTENTFGGYRRHENSFILFVYDFERYTSDGQDYTTLAVSTPEYILERMPLNEMKFQSGGAATKYYTTADLTPTDVAYYLLREYTNFHRYLNVSLWNNTSTIGNFNIRGDSNVWAAVRECHEYNFGICYFNRWSNLNGKPSPRARYDEWKVIADDVYSDTDPLTINHLLERTVHHRRDDEVNRVSLQAVAPDMTIIDSVESATGPGKAIEITSLVATDTTELSNWAQRYFAHLNREYDLNFKMGLGHELNPGDVFYYDEFATGTEHDRWLCTEISYEFDFAACSWLRNLVAEFLETTVET